MKNFFDQTKSMIDADDNLPESGIVYGKLYVACLNKDMIEACAADGHITNDDINANQGYNASLFTASNGSYYYNSNGLPTILSYEDEIMLYDEETSEYY